jgi:oxalate decarboxylase/phosphoglucose isomerase-like protein (cupin superfamily)
MSGRSLGNRATTENAGNTDLVFVAVFRAPRYEEVSFSD